MQVNVAISVVSVKSHFLVNISSLFLCYLHCKFTYLLFIWAKEFVEENCRSFSINMAYTKLTEKCWYHSSCWCFTVKIKLQSFPVASSPRRNKTEMLYGCLIFSFNGLILCHLLVLQWEMQERMELTTANTEGFVSLLECSTPLLPHIFIKNLYH